MSHWEERPQQGRSEELEAWALCKVADALLHLADTIRAGLSELATSIELKATPEPKQRKEK